MDLQVIRVHHQHLCADDANQQLRLLVSHGEPGATDCNEATLTLDSLGKNGILPRDEDC